jgi:hypothetical protein
MLDVAQNTVGGANPARSFGPTSDEEPKKFAAAAKAAFKSKYQGLGARVTNP